ncbi:MAG: 5-(carboxyamino)imidazole ribonucleotide synthase [Pirellulaceae bacterium]
MSQLIPPGSTLGVLGSGQLGRMFTIAARRLGYRVHVLSPDDDTPTGQVADLEIRASYDDLDAIAAFARGVSVVTFEFENVPAATTAAAEKFAPVRPGGNVLHISQNRLREKTFLKNAGIPVTPFLPVRSFDELIAGLMQFGFPAVLKTADWGYDGKGQVRIESAEQANTVWPQFAGREAILEKFIGFVSEVSVVGARGLDGSFVSYGPIRNSHANHILDISVMPAGVSERVAERAIEITREIFSRLEVVGVLCVEFFLDKSGELLVNELAPRPHNSGHLTIDACTTCQFEQQVRAVSGLPLGSPRQHRPAAMANLLGDLWMGGTPNWQKALTLTDIKLHLYGKAEPRPGRKMGHLTALADTPHDAAERVITARAALTTA